MLKNMCIISVNIIHPLFSFFLLTLINEHPQAAPQRYESQHFFGLPSSSLCASWYDAWSLQQMRVVAEDRWSCVYWHWSPRGLEGYRQWPSGYHLLMAAQRNQRQCHFDPWRLDIPFEFVSRTIHQVYISIKLASHNSSTGAISTYGQDRISTKTSLAGSVSFNEYLSLKKLDLLCLCSQLQAYIFELPSVIDHGI